MIFTARFFATQSNLGYQFYDAAGVAIGSRVTTGIVALPATGDYQVDATVPANAVEIYWNDSVTVAEAGQAISEAVALAAVKAKTDNIPASPAAVGSEMTLTAGERTSIGTAVWATTTRTLSSFGTLIADIWTNASRTLSAFGFTVTPSNAADTTAIRAKTDLFTFTGNLVNANATVEVGDIQFDVSQIWTHSERTLTATLANNDDVIQKLDRIFGTTPADQQEKLKRLAQSFSNEGSLTFGDLKSILLGFVSRVNSSFDTKGGNVVDLAINNALTFTQRKHDFEWLKQEFKVACNPYGYISQARDVDTDVPLKVKRIIKAFGPERPKLGEEISVPYLSRTGLVGDQTRGKSQYFSDSCLKVVHHGEKLYLLGSNIDNYNLYFDGVIWLPPLVDDKDTNFLLDYGKDFLIYRAIIELNFFMKEDERFQVTQAMVQDAWRSLVAWDVSLVSPTETEIEL